MVALAADARRLRDRCPRQTSMNSVPPRIVCRAPAKLNLFLEVLGRRPDGYHDLASLMVPLDWHDELSFQPAAELKLTCDHPALDVGPGNLILRAGRLLQQAAGVARGAAIHLSKRLPWAAGLGGGSSDAAATLRGLNELWNLKLPPAELHQLAAQLGSDVNFFLVDGPAWCTGRGEQVAPLDLRLELAVLLVLPGFGLKTPEVFNRLQVPAVPRDVEAARRQWTQVDNVEPLHGLMFNRLQEPALALRPELADVPLMLAAADTAGEVVASQLSGSGSAWFAVCRSMTGAQRLAALLPTQIKSWPRLAQAGLRFVTARTERARLPRMDA